MSRADFSPSALRAGIDELIDDIIADIQYVERKLDAASIRRILRRYGATYEYTQGEEPDPVDPPAGGGGTTPPTP